MLSLSFSRLAFTAVFVLFFVGTRLDAKYVPVDDTDTSRILYSSDSGWNVGDNCTLCLARLDKTKVFGGTWHDVIAGQDGPNDASFEFVFIGTAVRAIYTAFEFMDNSSIFTSNVNLKYSVDGIPRGDVVQDSAPTANRTTYIYNKTLIDVTGLTSVQHTLRVDLRTRSILLLDYLLYDDGDTDTSPVSTDGVVARTSATTTASTSSIPGVPNLTTSTNAMLIIGWVVAAVVILVLIGVFVWCFLERRRKRQPSGLVPFLGPEVSPLPQFLPSGAQPISTAATTQLGPNFNPQQSASSHADTHPSFVMGPNSSRVISQERIIHVPSNSFTSFSVPSNPPVPEAHQGSRVDKNRQLRIPRPSRQGPTTETAPPTRFYTNLTTTQVQPPNEPIEEGVIARQLSRSTLPPYSPGGFLDDEDVPPMPHR